MEAGSFFTIALLVVIGIIIFYNKIQKQKPINDKQEGIANNQDSALTETLNQNSRSNNYNDVSNTKAVLHSSEDEKLIFCRNCKNQLTPSTKGCLKCGFPPFSESNFCHECGCETKERQVLCISCNADLEIRSFESFESSIIIKKVETSEPDNSNSENNSNKHDTQKPQIKNIKPEKVQFKEWWSERTKKQKIWIVVGCLFLIGLINNLGGGKDFPNKFKNKKISELIIPENTLKINDDNSFELHIHYRASGQSYNFTGKIEDYDSGNSGKSFDRFNVSYDGSSSFHPRGQYKPSNLKNYWEVLDNQINIPVEGFNTIKGESRTSSLIFRVKE